MSKTLKTILIILGAVVLLLAGYGIARLLQDTQPSSVQHDYPFAVTVLVSGDFECVLTPGELTLHKGEVGTIEITNTVSGGFDANIMYLVSGLPEGSYSFSVNPVAPGQATTLTIDTATLNSNSVYVCQLTAGDTGTLEVVE